MKMQSTRLWMAVAVTLVYALGVGEIGAQDSVNANANRPQTEKLPQTYRTIRDWAQFPAVKGIVWPAAVTAIEPDRTGNIYVIYRCVENSCAGRSEDPILKFD